MISKPTAVKRILRRLCMFRGFNTITYNFCVEIGSKYNVHFHGYIKYDMIHISKVQQFLSIWKRYEGFYYVSNLTDLVKWHIYCHKDYWIHMIQINNITISQYLTDYVEYKISIDMQKKHGNILKYCNENRLKKITKNVLFE